MFHSRCPSALSLDSLERHHPSLAETEKLIASPILRADDSGFARLSAR